MGSGKGRIEHSRVTDLAWNELSVWHGDTEATEVLDACWERKMLCVSKATKRRVSGHFGTGRMAISCMFRQLKEVCILDGA